MKKTLKLAGLLLALVMVASMMSVTAFAGTITVTPPEGTSDGETYNAWKMLTIESYTGNTGTALADPATLTGATYIVDSAWKSFFENYEVGEGDDAKAAFVITNNATAGVDYVTLADGVTLDDTDMAALAKAALAYAKAAPISADATGTVSSGSATIDGLDDGWYLVDSSIGAVCMISNAAEDVAINDKNDVPTIEKEVDADYEDVTINDVIPYTVTVTAKDGGKNYKVIDTMSKGLTFNDDVAINDGTSDLGDTDFSVSSSTDSSTGVTTITITLPDPVADGTYTITYTATVNEDAVVNGENQTLSNSAKLTYGNNSEQSSEDTTTESKLTQFDVVKVDQDNKYLEGAAFDLYLGTTKVPVVCVDATKNIYRPATTEEIAAAGFESAPITAAKARVVGLDADLSYSLLETEWPDGYNQLDGKAAMAFSSDDTLYADIDSDYVYASTDSSKVNAIVNKKGNVLPETGGMGTTLIYIAGAILVIGAGVLLVAKKRMGTAK